MEAYKYGANNKWRISIWQSVETSDFNKYTSKTLENDCCMNLEIGKLCLSIQLAVNSR